MSGVQSQVFALDFFFLQNISEHGNIILVFSVCSFVLYCTSFL